MNNNYQLQTLQAIPVARTEEVASSSGRLAEITYALSENAAFTDRLKAALAKQVMDNTWLVFGYHSIQCITVKHTEHFKFISHLHGRSTCVRVASNRCV